MTSCSASVFTPYRSHHQWTPQLWLAPRRVELLKLSVCLSGQVCQWGLLGLLLNEVFPLVVSGCALRVRLAVEGKLMTVFGLSCFHFLVPVRLFPAADDPGSYGQHNHGDENRHCDHA